MSISVTLRRFTLSLSALAVTFLFISLFGCKQSTAPATDTTHLITHTSGFGWIYNNTTIDRKNFWSANSSGSAAYTDFGPGRTHQLDITLTVYTGANGVETTVELLLPMATPRTGKFNVATLADLTNSSITFKLDTARYVSQPGGTLEITKFDTINNTVSGTFSCDAKHGTETVHVSAGYFVDMPIYFGSFHQGLVTATVNGIQFTSQDAEMSPSFWSTDSAQNMVMMMDGDYHGDRTKEIAFAIQSPMAGYYYDLDPTTGARWYGTYVESGTPVISINSMSGAIGRLTITKFDWATHRISGTFYLHGYDKYGDYIDVENGVISNVEWFLL